MAFLVQEIPKKDTANQEYGVPEPLSGYLTRIGGGKFLGHSQEIRLSRQAKAGDPRARQKLIEKNLKLVVSVAKKYRAPRYKR